MEWTNIALINAYDNWFVGCLFGYRNRDIPLAMVKFPNLEQASSDAKHHMVGNEAHSLSLRPDPCQVCGYSMIIVL